MVNNPFRIIRYGRKNPPLIFTAEAQLSNENYDDELYELNGESEAESTVSTGHDKKAGPLEVPAFSRFVIRMTQKGEKNPPYVNIPLIDILEIELMFREAFHQKYVYRLSRKNNSSFQAFSVRFNIGNFRGMSPVDILKNNPDKGKAILSDLRGKLQSNLKSHPGNGKMIDAIDKALALQPEELNQEHKSDTKAPEILPVYEKDYKYLKSRKREDGKVFVYAVSIVGLTQYNNPWKVEIMNCYGHLMTSKAGTIVPNPDTFSDMIEKKIFLSDGEAIAFIRYMYQLGNSFLVDSFSEQYALACQLDELNRQRYSKENDVA